MPEDGRNIYKICREQAGYTQERAAELLNCSVRALARYESGETLVPDPVAYRMIQLYNSHYLGMEHLRLVSQVAAALLPPVKSCDFQTASIRLFNCVADFVEKHHDTRLLRIAEDNDVDEAERPDMDDILTELERLTMAATEVRLAAGKGT